jgi:hypothetical protein
VAVGGTIPDERGLTAEAGEQAARQAQSRSKVMNREIQPDSSDTGLIILPFYLYNSGTPINR